MYENDKNYRLAVTMLVLVGIYALASVLLRGWGGLPNDRARATTIREQLEEAGKNQSSATESIKAATGTTDYILREIDSGRKQIEAAAGTAGRIEESSRSSEEIIRECQSILQAVRARGKTENQ